MSMCFHSKLLPDGRCGIYDGDDLLATIGCPQACQEIIKVLQQRQLVEGCPDQSTQLRATHRVSRLESLYWRTPSSSEQAQLTA